MNSTPPGKGNETSAGARGVGEGRPDPPERLIHGPPLPALVGQMLPPRSGHPVVFPPPARLRFFPSGLDETGALQSMENRIEHAVGPLQLAPGQLANPFQDGVAIGVPFGQDGENQGSGCRRDQILVDVHRTGGADGDECIEVLYIDLQCTQGRARYTSTMGAPSWRMP